MKFGYKDGIILVLFLGCFLIFHMGYQAGESHTLKYMCRGLSEMLSADEPLQKSADAIVRSLYQNCLAE